MARDMRVAFKLSETKKEELEAYAESYGVTMSALCALIVGQWLHQQNKVINPMIQVMNEVVTKQLEGMEMDQEKLLNMVREQNRS